jgi:HTH-type transcriptional regulator / antitoxin HipB
MSRNLVHSARELGLAIRERRRDLGMAQLELATQVGVSRQWISDVERGKPRAEVGLVLRTLRALDLMVWVGTASEPRGRGAASVGRRLG